MTNSQSKITTQTISRRVGRLYDMREERPDLYEFFTTNLEAYFRGTLQAHRKPKFEEMWYQLFGEENTRTLKQEWASI